MSHFELKTRWQQDLPFYENFIPLGEGSFGQVCGAIDKRSNEKVAIKKLSGLFDFEKREAIRALREISLLQALKHENIIQLKSIVIGGPNEKVFNEIYLIYRKMDSDLRKIMPSSQTLWIEHIQTFIYQILRALKYIHSVDVIHRDVKPENVLVNANCDVKLCDFNNSRKSSPLTMTLTVHTTTLWYRSPEGLLNERVYSPAVDIWSVGCVLAELLAEKPIFERYDEEQMLECIRAKLGVASNDDNDDDEQRSQTNSGSGVLPTTFGSGEHERLGGQQSESARALLDRMLVWQPERRVTAAAALSHEFFHSLHDENDEPICERPVPTLALDNCSKSELRREFLKRLKVYADV